MVILNSREQEYLLHALETAHGLREQNQFYLWSQGALQALLPHRLLLCLRLDGEGNPQRIDCLHSAVLDASQRRQLCDAREGPALDLLRQWRQGGAVPLALETPALGPALIHGTGMLPSGGSCFMLLGLPAPAEARHSWLLQLLLPCLHMALQRIAAGEVQANHALMSVSPRQAQILDGVREGKSNEEIGQILGISSLTVKNHLQRLYRQLGVNNRAHAVALYGACKFD
ncbi:LuxR C-terminal-related transcriptional regulator [Pseudoduganella sp. UC29_106]|uniref:LuxR C-terminal-related transcriptional regulator n=1 Tax=Pseudoduganella sp. UC29_106 TaxID=3374553 RepID=UPI003756BE0B